MCKFILLLSLLFFIQDSIPMEKSQRGDSLSDSSYYEEPIPIGKVNRRNLKYDTKRDMYYKDDGWNEYKKSKDGFDKYENYHLKAD